MDCKFRFLVRKQNGRWRIMMTRRIGGVELSPLFAHCATWREVPAVAAAMYANPLERPMTREAS